MTSKSGAAVTPSPYLGGSSQQTKEVLRCKLAFRGWHRSTSEAELLIGGLPCGLSRRRPRAEQSVRLRGQPRHLYHRCCFCEILSEVADLPAGVINDFTESQGNGASRLAAAPDVPEISFTGSTTASRMTSSAGTEYLRRFELELGGEAPILVFSTSTWRPQPRRSRRRRQSLPVRSA